LINLVLEAKASDGRKFCIYLMYKQTEQLDGFSFDCINSYFWKSETIEKI